MGRTEAITLSVIKIIKVNIFYIYTSLEQHVLRVASVVVACPIASVPRTYKVVPSCNYTSVITCSIALSSTIAFLIQNWQSNQTAINPCSRLSTTLRIASFAYHLIRITYQYMAVSRYVI